MSDLVYNEFYNKLKEFVNENSKELTPPEASVVMIRVALEHGCESMGVNSTVYMMSKLLSVTLGIMAGDESSSFEDLMEGFDYETMH
jgi:hypothetical protein